jgi:hypothetical protein
MLIACFGLLTGAQDVGKGQAPASKIPMIASTVLVLPDAVVACE